MEQNYDTLKVLLRYGKYAEGLMVSNHGNIQFNRNPLFPSPVKDGPRFELWNGIYDKYDEIVIPGIDSGYIFVPYRLIAEV